MLTLDSSEPLEDALRVVGALYGVKLVVAREDSESQRPVESTRPKRRTQRPRTGRSSIRPGEVATGDAVVGSAAGGGNEDSTGSAKEPRNAEMRAWARENGMKVSGRGKLPASVIAAYRDAHGE